MRKLFVSAVALLFVSQITFATEGTSDTKSSGETKAVTEVTPEKENAAIGEVASEQKTETEKSVKAGQIADENEPNDKVKKEEIEKPQVQEISADEPSKVEVKETPSADTKATNKEQIMEEKVIEKSQVKSQVSGKKGEEVADKPSVVEEADAGKAKSDEYMLPIIDGKDFLRNVNGVLSFINPEVVAAKPIQNGEEWVIFVELRPDIVQALVEKNAISAVRILTLYQGVNPTLLQIVSDMLKTAVSEISSETVDILTKLNLVRNEDFKSVMQNLGLSQIYSAKINEVINKDPSFVAIPFVYSNDKLNIDFTKVKEILKPLIEIAGKIQASEKIIIDKKQERDNKITPEMQANLDQLKSLEEENIVLKKQLEDEKARVAENIKNSESAKANAISEKTKIEKEISDAENQKAAAEGELGNINSKLSDNGNQLNASQAELPNAENDLRSKQSTLDMFNNEKGYYESLLERLNSKGKVFREALNEAKGKFNNRNLNKKSAISQTQNMLNNLQGQLGNAQAEFNTAQTNIQNIQNRSAQLNQEKAELEQRKVAAEEKVRNISSKIEALKNKKAEVESMVANAERELNNLQSGIDAKAKLVQDNENKIKTLKDMPSTQRAIVYAGEIDTEIGNQVDNIYTQYKNAATA